jgi:hypothetical protein
MKLEFSRQLFEWYSNIKYHENPPSGTRVVPRGRTDITNLILAFHIFSNAPNMVCLCDSHNHERPTHYAHVSSNYSLNSRMQAQVPPTLRSSKYRKCWPISCRTILLETRNFVAALHRTEEINKKKSWLCISLKYITNINRTYNYYVSLQICTKGCFECRGISSLKILYYLLHSSREEHHTALHGIQVFNIPETYTKLLPSNLTNRQKSHRIQKHI